jgi:hypothetical protein
MLAFRRLSFAIVLVALSLAFGVSRAAAAPEAQNTVSSVSNATPLLSSILNIVNTIGDDNFATADLTTLVDPSTTSAQHYGPYASGSSDSGTCGNNWADDTFQRHFTIFNKAGSVVVVEQFKDGTFHTPSTDPPNTSQSPGACTNSPGPIGNGGTVAVGITGSMHGYFIIPIPTGVSQTSSDPHCNAIVPTNSPCFTTTFMNSHFLTCFYPVVCQVTTFLFTYDAADQGLIEHHWKNASLDRGGNLGDIRST